MHLNWASPYAMHRPLGASSVSGRPFEIECPETEEAPKGRCMAYGEAQFKCMGAKSPEACKQRGCHWHEYEEELKTVQCYNIHDPDACWAQKTGPKCKWR